MFCTRCGQEVESGARFCTSCGAPLSSGGAGAGSARAASGGPSGRPMPGAGEAPAASKARPKGKGRLVIGVIALVLIAFAGFIAVAAIGGSDSDTTIVTYGSDEPVSVTRSARIVPTDADGIPLERYVVRVVHAVDEHGAKIDLSGEPQSAQVSGTDGFTMETVILNHETGTYIFEIDNGSEVQTTPPIVIDDENGISDEVHVEPPASSDDAAADEVDDVDEVDDTARGADALFLEKIEELQDEYGEPTLEVTEDTNAYCASIRGLAYAELVDFGDGEERLVVMWNESEDGYEGSTDVLWEEATPSSLSGTVEVWEYDEGTDELVALLNDGDGIELFRMMFDYYETRDGGIALDIYSYDRNTNGSTSTDTFYGVDSTGAFGIIWEEVISSSGSGTTYSVNGEAMDYEEFAVAREEMFASGSAQIPDQSVYVYFIHPNRDEALNGFADSTSDDLFPAATMQTVSDTIALLEDRVAAVGDADA